MLSDRTIIRPSRSAELIARRFADLAVLTEREQELVRMAASRPEAQTTGAELSGPSLLTSGWACRRARLADGSRQIFAFLVPGDLFDGRRLTGRARNGVFALTPVETISASPLLEAVDDVDLHHGLADAIEAMRTEQEKLLLDHIVRLGSLTAYERLAHLILDLRERLARIGLADEHRLPMPLTQETLADALGLSVVHVNRTLQQLRRERLIELRGGVAMLPDPNGLADLCGFET
ncbi:MAG TPA: Crp/Fnr family transcriptional regulator, partial [Phenylobacterium sp.]